MHGTCSAFYLHNLHYPHSKKYLKLPRKRTHQNTNDFITNKVELSQNFYYVLGMHIIHNT